MRGEFERREILRETARKETILGGEGGEQGGEGTRNSSVVEIISKRMKIFISSTKIII